MASDQSIALKQLELRLLRCSLSDPSLPQPSLPPSGEPQLAPEASTLCLAEDIRVVVEFVEKGLYVEALASNPMKILFGNFTADFTAESDTSKMAKQFFNMLEKNIAHFLNGKASTDIGDLSARKLLAMAAGVASLFLFMQANVTGPPVTCCVFPAQAVWKAGPKVQLEEDTWDVWARQVLMVDGCDILGKCWLPQYLMLANILLLHQTEGTPIIDFSENSDPVTQTWWICRALRAHQQILAERSPSLYSLLTSGSSSMLKKFGSPEAVQELDLEEYLHAGEANLLSAAAQLEYGLIESAYGHVDSARHGFSCAADNSNLQLDVIGALGFRTIYQVDPKAQMVLVANSQNGSQRIQDFSGIESNQVNLNNIGQSDVLLKPKLVVEAQGELEAREEKYAAGDHSIVLNSIEQALVLANCMDIKKSNPDDELRNWQMAPFIEAVDSQTRSHFIVKSWCHLLRVRWERSRHRTQERAYVTMENLVEEIKNTATHPAKRMCYVFCVQFPTISALLKEFAELKVSCGLVREALSLFEELELWDNLIDCYCLLGKKGTATHLINDRLKVQPEDPRLWCSLGDVTLDDSCYFRAWEVSKHRFSRAQRSLARTAYNRGDYRTSMEHWAAALALNPLHPDGWFALGSAALKAKAFDKALQAFTRSVQLDPHNGESWNNIAAINMHKQRNREAFVAFREALKYKRESWQMWENFSQVAMDIGNYVQAATAIEKVLDLSREKRVDVPLLTKLIEELEKREVVLCQHKKFPGLGKMMNSESPCCREKDVEKANTDPSSHVVTGEKTDMSESFAGKKCVTGSRDSEVYYGLDVKHLEEVGLCAEVEGPKQELLKDTELLSDLVGKLLSRAVEHGNIEGEVWGLQARWYRIKGDLAMASHALLKQVRALQGSNWQQHRERFNKFSSAAVQLCEVYLDIYQCTGSTQSFSSAQMLLRNTMKQGVDFAESDEYKHLSTCLSKFQNISHNS